MRFDTDRCDDSLFSASSDVPPSELLDSLRMFLGDEGALPELLELACRLGLGRGEFLIVGDTAGCERRRSRLGNVLLGVGGADERGLFEL